MTVGVSTFGWRRPSSLALLFALMLNLGESVTRKSTASPRARLQTDHDVFFALRILDEVWGTVQVRSGPRFGGLEREREACRSGRMAP